MKRTIQLLVISSLVFLAQGCGGDGTQTDEVGVNTAKLEELNEEESREAIELQKTRALLLAIGVAVHDWMEGEGKADGACPSSGTNSLDTPYAGNLRLYRQLVFNPKRKGRRPFIEVTNERVGFLQDDDKTWTKPVEDERAIFIDGFGQPIVYWEWESKTNRTANNDPAAGGLGSKVSPSELALARNKGGYDLYSAGKDRVLGTADDLNYRAESVADNPFRKTKQ